jgi:hypothetical protein
LDANRLSQGQVIAACSAIALFIISFLPWFSVPAAAITVGGTTIGGSVNRNMWEFEQTLDVYLLIVILIAVVPTLLALLGGRGDAPLAPVATALLGGVGTLLIFYQLFDHGSGASIKIGLILGLIATAGITMGGYLSMQEDLGGERY